MMDHFKKHYDYVICDTAPCLPVSDSNIINAFVDTTLYVVRADYTHLKILKEIRDQVVDKKISNMNIVFNALDFTVTRYGYGYGYVYDYGYSYGYGYGNTKEAVNKKNKSLFKRAK